MEESVLPKSTCFGCLIISAQKSLQEYKIRNEALKSIFKVDTIYLCYLCQRKAQQAELFIQNVQSNHILLENFHNITESTIRKARVQSQALVNLSQSSQESIHVDGKDDSTIDSFIVYTSCNDREILASGKKIEVKVEFQETDDILDHIEEDFMHNDNDVKPLIKEEDEDEYPLKLLKELQLEGVNIKCLRQPRRKGKLKKKLKKESKQDLKIETMNITRQQCLQERAMRATDKIYVDATYKCEDCVKGFNFKASYEKHLLKHSKDNGDHTCDICKQRFISEEKLTAHQRYHYVRYRCRVCHLTRISRLTIKDHYTAFHYNGHCPYPCTHCPKVFNRQVSLRKHITRVHRYRERVQCAHCNKTYATKEILKAHMIERHTTEVGMKKPKRYICQICGTAFNAPSQLRNHSMKHSDRRDYYCVECNKSFKSDAILKHHLKTAMSHTNYLDLPLHCQYCDKRFAIKRDLERHTNRVHLNIKPFLCDKCDKSYVNAWSLNDHKRLIHEGYKRPLRFPCTMCDKVFDRNQILKAHIRTHTGERPYQCTRCPAKFTQASILRTHVKLIHLKLTRDGRPKNVAVK